MLARMFRCGFFECRAPLEVENQRSDARYCNGACKQAEYRRRRRVRERRLFDVLYARRGGGLRPRVPRVVGFSVR